MICPNCGYEDSGKYCSNCGALLEPVTKKKKTFNFPLFICLLLTLGLAVFVAVNIFDIDFFGNKNDPAGGFNASNKVVGVDYKVVDEKVYNNYKVVIEAMTIEKEDDGNFGLTFRISNKNKFDIEVDFRNLVVNGYAYSCSTWENVEANEIITFVLSSDDFYYYDFAKLDSIDSISLNFSIYDDDYNEIDSVQQCNISYFDNDDFVISDNEAKEFIGKTIYETDGFAIKEVFIGKNYYSGISVILCFENYTDSKLTVRLSDIYINEELGSDLDYIYVDPNNKLIEEVYIYDSEEMDIDINNIHIMFDVNAYTNDGSIVGSGTVIY